MNKAESASVLRSLLRGFILHGYVDPRGKSSTDLERELKKWVKSWPDNIRIIWALDHRGDILSEARRYFEADQHELSCLMFATWTEHWVNQLIALRCHLLKVPDDYRKDMLRVVPLVAKCTWLLRLLGAKPLPVAHLERIRFISDTRNAFVHYKWTIHDPDGVANESKKQRLIEALTAYERTVKYLQKYESDYLLHRASKKVSQLVRRTQERAD